MIIWKDFCYLCFRSLFLGHQSSKYFIKVLRQWLLYWNLEPDFEGLQFLLHRIEVTRNPWRHQLVSWHRDGCLCGFIFERLWVVHWWHSKAQVISCDRRKFVICSLSAWSQKEIDVCVGLNNCKVQWFSLGGDQVHNVVQRWSEALTRFEPYAKKIPTITLLIVVRNDMNNFM